MLHSAFNAQQFCFYRQRTGPLAIPTFDFSFAFNPRNLYYRRRQDTLVNGETLNI